MIKDWKETQELIRDFQNELKTTKYNVEINSKIKEKVCTCVELDKKFKIYTGQDLNIEFKDEEENYYLYFGQGFDFAKEKEGFAWLSDEHSIFFFERPYEEKVLNVLKRLLPNEKIVYNKNDIYINGTKNGASLRTGYQTQKGDGIEDLEISQSEKLTGMIYILRWDNLNGLNEAFKDVAHHQERLNSKEPLSTLSDFLKNITKEEFINLLEN